MLRLFARSSKSLRVSRRFPDQATTILPIARTMATGKSENADLKASKLFDVSDLTALVTGGGTGIGLMITQALVSNGAKVYITGRREEVLQSVVEQYNTGPGKILPLPGDVSQKADILRLAQELSEKEPNGIQLLVNNAGIAREDATSYSKQGTPDFSSAQSISEHLLKSDPDQWLNTFQTNTTALYFTSAAFLPLLEKGNKVLPGYSSSIINVSSISGLMKGSSSGQFAYASSKAAVITLSRMLATTFKDVKVRVNIIAPGLFPSEMTAAASGPDQKSILNVDVSNPAGRTGNDSDMAACILYLVGPGGAFLNNQIIHPEGGHLLVH
ncbi:short chain dehydrogenase/reductase [Xylona heveae TC161]|uniref:Short chain dehydrogenase/reductase n=1 Tax=Xylona heveae (strain CBS 132557 / TC161) TaxID=1328760 RepID=A0A165HSX5_XYLHT|nr:short chain dehydrogenase/reductase [Xylona heveae TC161]KZF23892.1 short chain dehydrogenase/reductase [Xylona heveae TC161]